MQGKVHYENCCMPPDKATMKKVTLLIKIQFLFYIISKKKVLQIVRHSDQNAPGYTNVLGQTLTLNKQGVGEHMEIL